MNGFTCTQQIMYRGVGDDLTVDFPNLMSHIIEASLVHSESTAYPMAWYAQNKQGYILTNWQVQVLAYPKWHDTITIHTWPTRFKGICAERAFHAVDANGNTMLLANTAWVYMDTVRRRPVRPPENIVESYGPVLPPVLEKDFHMPDIASSLLLNSCRLTAGRRDTDSNNHVNNIAYVEWAMEAVPDALYGNCRIVGMQCQYKKECLRGTPVVVEAYGEPENSQKLMILVKDESKDGQLLCTLRFDFA